MKNQILPLVLLLSVLTSHLSVAETNKIKLQTENFPPYNYSVEGRNFAKDKGVTGISVDIVREVFKRANVDYSLTLRFPWDRVYEKALNKKNYGVFSMVRSEEREALFHWVGPLAPDEWVFFALADKDITINSLEDAKAYKVGGYKGDALSEYLMEKGLRLQLSAQDKRNVKLLKSGAIDLWASNDFSGRALAKQEGFELSKMKKIFTIDQVDLFLGINKETNPAVVQKLQTALDEMKEDGTIAKTIEQYTN